METKLLKKTYPSTTKNAGLLLRVINNDFRQKILNLIWEQEVTVGDMVKELGWTQPEVSVHLMELRKAGLVKWRRDGKHIFYKADLHKIQRLHELSKQLLTLN